MAIVAICGASEIVKSSGEKDIKVLKGKGDVVCGENPVVVKLDPTDPDDKFYSGTAQIRAYSPDNSDNPSGFSINISEHKNPKEYVVGVSSVNEEGVSDLSPSFLDQSPFTGNEAVDFIFSANQGLWSIDINPEAGTVSVSGTCLDQRDKNDSVLV